MIFRKKKLMWLSFLQMDWQKQLHECSTSSRQLCLATSNWSSGWSRTHTASTLPCGSSVARIRATTARGCATFSMVKATTCGLRTPRASRTHQASDDWSRTVPTPLWLPNTQWETTIKPLCTSHLASHLHNCANCFYIVKWWYAIDAAFRCVEARRDSPWRNRLPRRWSRRAEGISCLNSTRK